jgi:hypothetical protein
MRKEGIAGLEFGYLELLCFVFCFQSVKEAIEHV